MSFVLGSEQGPRADVPRAKRISGQPELTHGALRRIVRVRMWADMAERGLSCAEIAAMTPGPAGRPCFSESHVRASIRRLRRAKGMMAYAE